MMRYSPAEKISERYLAAERQKLKEMPIAIELNPFRQQIVALEQIPDNYEQLKECVRLQTEMQRWISNGMYAREQALYFLEALELAIGSEEALEKNTPWFSNVFERAEAFFRNIESNSESKKFSPDVLKEILQIRDKFFANLWKKDFVLVKASELSLDDDFMQYVPRYKQEIEFKKLLEGVIRNGVKDFWKSKMDPCPTIDGESYYFKKGAKVLTGPWYQWWANHAYKNNCRLGRKSEYIAFCGVIIKGLIAQGCNVKQAWYSVCINSEALGNYRPVIDKRNYKRFGPTGSQKILQFYDLLNAEKLLAEDWDSRCCGCWHAGGGVFSFQPMTHLEFDDERNCNHPYSVGWIVRDVE